VNSNVQPKAPVTLTASHLLLRYGSPSGHVWMLTATCTWSVAEGQWMAHAAETSVDWIARACS
jgi:hypothetical protein